MKSYLKKNQVLLQQHDLLISDKVSTDDVDDYIEFPSDDPKQPFPDDYQGINKYYLTLVLITVWIIKTTLI